MADRSGRSVCASRLDNCSVGARRFGAMRYANWELVSGVDPGLMRRPARRQPEVLSLGRGHGTRPVLNVSERDGAPGALIAITEYACSPLP